LNVHFLAKALDLSDKHGESPSAKNWSTDFSTKLASNPVGSFSVSTTGMPHPGGLFCRSGTSGASGPGSQRQLGIFEHPAIGKTNIIITLSCDKVPKLGLRRAVGPIVSPSRLFAKSGEILIMPLPNSGHGNVRMYSPRQFISTRLKCYFRHAMLHVVLWCRFRSQEVNPGVVTAESCVDA